MSLSNKAPVIRAQMNAVVGKLQESQDALSAALVSCDQNQDTINKPYIQKAHDDVASSLIEIQRQLATYDQVSRQQDT